MATLSDLHRRLGLNDNRYGLHFAGHPRLTRRVDLLDTMIRDADAVMADARALKAGSDRQAILQTAERQRSLYAGERAQIAQLQAQMGPLAREASLLGTRANIVFHRYARHFAGQSRGSRDGTLLRDMVAELGSILSQMQAIQADQAVDGLEADIAVVEGRMVQFNTEAAAIAAAQTDAALDDQASALANTANTLFAQYAVWFAGLPRVSRRPELLVRMIEALEAIGERMKALRTQGFHNDHNDNNIGIVDNRLQLWTQELAAIRQERETTPFSGLVQNLATAADAELEQYGKHFAGQSRRTRDLKKLSDILDRLDEVERQMARLDSFQDDADNQLHLAVVRDALVMYQNEYDQIAQVQGKA